MPSQFLTYGCCNLVDGCRTLSYLQTANHIFAPGVGAPNAGFSACGCCITPDEEEMPESGKFVSPAADPAPWYSASDPRSAHYFGPMILSWKESQPYLRETLETRVGGKTKSPKLNRKEVVVRFMLCVDDACAIPFAKAHFLQRLTCTSSIEGACGLPDLEWHECYNPSDCNGTDYAIRGFSRAAATSIVWEEDEIPSCLGIIAEVTFTSELPWVYESCPTPVVADLPIVAGESFCNICKPECPIDEDPCVNTCGAGVVEPFRVNLRGCYCEPASLYRNCFTVTKDPRIGEGTLEIIVNVGSGIMRNLRVRAWPNPFGFTSGDDFLCVPPCFDIALAGPFPAYSVITIDGKARKSLLKCNNGTQNGRTWIESPDGQPFTWPDVGCDGLIVCLDASAMTTAEGVSHTADDATLTINQFHRELR